MKNFILLTYIMLCYLVSSGQLAKMKSTAPLEKSNNGGFCYVESTDYDGKFCVNACKGFDKTIYHYIDSKSLQIVKSYKLETPASCDDVYFNWGAYWGYTGFINDSGRYRNMANHYVDFQHTITLDNKTAHFYDHSSSGHHDIGCVVIDENALVKPKMKPLFSFENKEIKNTLEGSGPLNPNKCEARYTAQVNHSGSMAVITYTAKSRYCCFLIDSKFDVVDSMSFPASENRISTFGALAYEDGFVMIEKLGTKSNLKMKDYKNSKEFEFSINDTSRTIFVEYARKLHNGKILFCGGYTVKTVPMKSGTFTCLFDPIKNEIEAPIYYEYLSTEFDIEHSNALCLEEVHITDDGDVYFLISHFRAFYKKEGFQFMKTVAQYDLIGMTKNHGSWQRAIAIPELNKEAIKFTFWNGHPYLFAPNASGTDPNIFKFDPERYLYVNTIQDHSRQQACAIYKISQDGTLMMQTFGGIHAQTVVASGNKFFVTNQPEITGSLYKNRSVAVFELE